jgi:hypothetical protein
VIRERFPGADILGQRGHWDDATREVILDRVHNVPRYRFFDSHERRTLEALCARVIPQDRRPAGDRVRIAPWIDDQCAGGDADGFRFADMPPHAESWRRGLRGIDEVARRLHDRNFVDLDAHDADDVLDTVRAGSPPGEAWGAMPARRWWISVALREIVGVYYAHPAAWDEIGYGGPAYPRGYAALNHGAREWWEPREDPGAREADERDRRARERARARRPGGGLTGTGAGSTRRGAASGHGGNEPVGAAHLAETEGER